MKALGKSELWLTAAVLVSNTIMDIAMEMFFEMSNPQKIGYSIVISAIVLSLLWSHISYGFRRKLFLRRKAILFHEWYETHYGKPDAFPPNQVYAVLSLIAGEIGVSPTQLLPTDNIRKSLSLKWVIYDDTEEVLNLMLDEYIRGITGKILVASGRWQTVDDMISGVVSNLSQWEEHGKHRANHVQR